MNIHKLYKILNEGNADIFAGEEMVDEMAMIVGSLDNSIRDVIEAHPELEGNELKRAIRGNADVRAALNGEKLHDNQLNRFIAKVQSGAPRPEVTNDAPTSTEPGAPPAPKKYALSNPAKMAILSKLDAGATPEELAPRYGIEVDDILALQAASAAEDEGDVKDIEGLRQGDDTQRAPELKAPEQTSRSVDAEILAKAERAFYINRNANKESVLNNLKIWAAKRNDKVDITKPQHPLRGASDEAVDSAIEKVAKKLGVQRVAAAKRLGAQSLQGNEMGDEGGRRADSARDLEGEFRPEESFETFSKTLSEHMKTLKSTSTVRYPAQVKFSEEFIKKLAEEFTNHSAIKEGQGVIRNIEEKMLKALRMHLHEISKAKKLNEEPQFAKGKLPADEYTSKNKEPKKDPKYDFKNRPGTYGYDKDKPTEE